MEGAPVDFQGSDRFVLVRRLGEGGMGIVYEAIDRARGLHVALKTLRETSPEMLLRLKNEFRALHELHHDNLVSLGELVAEGGRWFFTMELVDGVDLVRWVRPGGVLDVARLRAALPQLVGALQALHRAGKVHRDVKPSNVMVTPAGRVVLLDFGLTTRVAVDDSLTDGSIVGSVDYMAPEQAGGGAVGPAADWYSLGVVLFEALTGELPFSGTPVEVLDRKDAQPARLVKALAPEVSDDLAELCRALLQRDPAARPSERALAQRFAVAAAAPSEEILPVEPPFVGRIAELATLWQAFDDARANGPVSVFVHGESGVGKTALVAQLVRSLVEAHPDVLVLEGRCYERELTPFKGFDGIVDALTRRLCELSDDEVAPLVPGGVDALVRVFPVLARVRAIARHRAATVDDEGLRRRQRAFAALRELIGRLAGKQPVVLVLEDFQWADEDSLALRRELMRGRDLPGRLLVATLRAQSGMRDFLRRATLSADEDPGDVRDLALAPLSAEESLALVGEIVGPRELDRIDAATLVREGHGHPLFLTQLAHRALAGDAAAAPNLPAALWDRVRAEPEEARRLIEVVSLAAGSLPQQVAAQAAGLDAAAVGRATAMLRANHLVRTGGSRPEDSIEPYHDQIRAAVLDHVAPAAQQRWHRALAEALAARPSPDVNALVVHWLGAGDRARAAEAAVRAAGEADALLAFDRAAKLWERAVELADGDEQRRARLWRLGAAMACAGRPRQAIDAYGQAALLERDETARVELWRRSAELLLRIGEVDEGIALLRQVLAAVGMRYPASPRRALAALFVERVRLRVRGLRFRERPPSTLDERTRVRIDTAFAAGETLSTVDHVRGADFQTRGLLWALQAGDAYRVGRSVALEAGYSSAFGTRGAARTARLLGEARRLAERTAHPHLAAIVGGIDAIAASMEGRFAAAVEKMAHAEPLLRATPGSGYELATTQFFHVMALALRGELPALAESTRLWRREAAERGDLYTLANLSNGYANLGWLVEGDAATARAQATATMGVWSQRAFYTQHFYGLVAQANLDLYEGAPDRAFGHVQHLWQGLRGSLLNRVQFIRICALDLRARAALAAMRSSTTSESPKILRALAAASATLLEEEDAAWATALAGLIRAQLDDSPYAIERAAESCERAGLGVYAAVARRRAGHDDGWLQARGVRDADAWTRLWCPGGGPA